MGFEHIIGHKKEIEHLAQSILQNRIPHAQLFIAPEGVGALKIAIAYAEAIMCNNDLACSAKFKTLNHPDVHFAYPTVATDKVKTKPKSIDFISDWRTFYAEKPFGSLYDWYDILDVKNKQGEIRVDDAQEILKTLALKSYEGGYKIMIIWMADKINISASNKLLKILEEPTNKTVFLLIAEKEEDIIQTIRSRCQTVRFNKLEDQDIIKSLVANTGINESEALLIAKKASGNYNNALQMATHTENDLLFETWFVTWVRAAFRAKGNAAAIQDLILWSEQIAVLGRETQKKFLLFCIDFFRQALLINYQTPDLVTEPINKETFSLEKFAPFVNGNNINDIFKEISEAIYHIERNGNAKIILTDLSIKLTRLIHKK
jgi:DNA polymerase III subunit delta'